MSELKSIDSRMILKHRSRSLTNIHDITNNLDKCVYDIIQKLITENQQLRIITAKQHKELINTESLLTNILYIRSITD
jgi:hypothetical protein